MADFRHSSRPFRFWLPYWSSPAPKNPTSSCRQLVHKASSKSQAQAKASFSPPEDHSNKQPSDSERNDERQTTRKMISTRSSSTSEKSSHKLAATEQVTSRLQSQNPPPTLLAKSNMIKDSRLTKVEPNQELPNKDSSSVDHINNKSKKIPETQVEYKKSEHKDENYQKTAEVCSADKGRKIVVSTIPRDSIFEGDEHAAYKEEIEEGFTKLRQKMEVGNSKQASNGQGLNIITLAGKNKGASMAICTESIWNHKGKTAIAANINSNVQNINNSSLHQSICSVRNPGVHMNLSSSSTKSIESSKTKENAKAETRDSKQKPVSEPRIRRRCLRALFMESSESDPENPQKPRRHGCRYRCNEKKREDDDV